MISHQPEEYNCPFCLVVNGIENEHVLTRQDDIIYKNAYVTAFIASHWWPNNKGHILIVPNRHYENIYEIPDDYICGVHKLEKRIAKALKIVYKCDGVSSRQHNEPAGNQDVWHYHLHVFPRYRGDNLYETCRENSNAKERKDYANRLREYLEKVE